MGQEKSFQGVNEVQHFLETVYERFKDLNAPEDQESEAFIKTLNQAHREWQGAESFFDTVSDPDLIDHAIYRMAAAKSRYTYLLKQAKKEGIKGSKIE